MASIICLVLFTIMLIITVNYYVSTLFEFAKALVHKKGTVEFWHGAVMVGICYILHHFI